MKISYSNYPILKKLHQKSLGVIPLFENDKSFFDVNGKSFTDGWKKNCHYFSEEINVITDPFIKATSKVEDKLIDLLKDFTVNDSNDFTVNGCYILKDRIYMIHYDIKKGAEEFDLCLYLFDKNGTPVGCMIENGISKTFGNSWVSTLIEEDNYTFLARCVWAPIAFKMFKTFAEVETNVVNPKSKIKTEKIKYVNDTEFKINYLDSKWFTNIVRSEGFKVSGHFRFQPKKKDGKWTKELIWINDFEKSGYTSKAKIIHETP